MNINILSTVQEELLLKQYSPDIFPSEYKFYYNSREKIDWDLVVVYEEINDVYELRCKKKNVLFISGEPPICKCYPKSFLDQFSQVISAHQKLPHSNNHLTQQSLLWYFGYNFDKQDYSYNLDDLINLEANKEKKISFITSSRRFLPGHRQRLKFLKAMQKRYDSEIDIYGSGISYVKDKADAILPYKFTICIENSMEPHYWSEKISDAILGYSIPVYWGCPNIEDYFPSCPYIGIDIKNLKNAYSTIEDILLRGDELYKEKLPDLIDARNKLLYEYNIYPSIIKYYNAFFSKEQEYENIILRPSKDFDKSLPDELLLRLRRFFLKKL